jgi:glycine/D-amino acid oxidase-like deaminating enzyme
MLVVTTWQVKQLDPGVRRLEGKGFHSAYPDCLASSSGSTSSLVPDRLAHLAQRVTHPRKSHLADFPRRSGYVNPTSGWGEATRACEVVLEDIKRMGCKLVPGKEVTGMTFIEHESTRGGKRTVNGVKFSDGSEMKADLVVIAAGAWTPALFAQPMMGGLPAVVAAGQCVAKIQLTPEEAEEYRDIPVVSRRSPVSRRCGSCLYANQNTPPDPRLDHRVLLFPSQSGWHHEARHPRRWLRQHVQPPGSQVDQRRVRPVVWHLGPTYHPHPRSR